MEPEPSVRAEPIYMQVARTFRNKIEAGVLRDGEVLPSTKELAAEWGVSDFTISEAMKVLASEGLVTAKSRANRVVSYPQGERRQPVRPKRPRALLVGGFPGSGKTEFGRILARLTAWPMLDKDTLTRPVVEAALEIMGLSPNDRESSAYLEKIRPREYEALMAAAIENIDCGNSVILTAPFIRELGDEAWIQRTTATFNARGTDVYLAWIYCDEATMHTYMRQRGAARDASKLADWPAYLASINLDLRPIGQHFLLDNSATCRPLQDQASEVARKLLAEVPA